MPGPSQISPPSAIFSGAPYREGEYDPTRGRAEDDLTAWQGLAQSKNAISLRVQQYVLSRTSLEDYQAWGRALELPELQEIQRIRFEARIDFIREFMSEEQLRQMQRNRPTGTSLSVGG